MFLNSSKKSSVNLEIGWNLEIIVHWYLRYNSQPVSSQMCFLWCRLHQGLGLDVGSTSADASVTFHTSCECHVWDAGTGGLPQPPSEKTLPRQESSTQV